MRPPTEVGLTLPRPHEAQRQVLREAQRFNILSNGRRWGKTQLAMHLMAVAAARGNMVSFHSPTYKMGTPVWDELYTILRPAIREKNEVERQIKLITGGVIDFWSADSPDASRGRKYHRVIVDEAAAIGSKVLAYLIGNVVRPSLTDYRGDFWAMSTPKGRVHTFAKLWERGQAEDGWASWSMPTASNPFIDPAEIEEARRQLDPVVFDQEYLGLFVDFTSSPFAYSFKHTLHVEHCADNPALPLWLSFDFNVSPMTCLIGQHELGSYAHFFDEIYLKDSNIYSVCDTIRTRYPGRLYIVTGDATGAQRDGRTRENATYWRIIRQQLGIAPGSLHVPAVNPHIEQTKVVLNSLLHHHPRFIFDPNGCKETIQDLKYVEVDESGALEKGKDRYRSHLLDCLRYYCYTFLRKYVA